MDEELAPFLDGPIAGQSLTAEPGNRPWQNPPQYTTVDEALEYYIPRMVDPEILPQMIDAMEMGVPLTTIANTLQSGGVMQGYHTIDVGVLIMPVLVEMMAYLGDEAGIKYSIGTERDENSEENSEISIAKAKQDLKIEIEEQDVDIKEISDSSQQQELPLEMEEPKGLMARRM